MINLPYTNVAGEMWKAQKEIKRLQRVRLRAKLKVEAPLPSVVAARVTFRTL